MKELIKFVIRHSSFVILFLIILAYFAPIWKDRQVPFPGHLLMSFFSPWKEEAWEGYPAGVPRKDLLGFDTVRMMGPWRKLVTDELRKGRLPTWNPHQFMGVPLLANSQSAVFFPPNWLYLVLPFSVAWTLLVIAQPTIAFFSMRVFLMAMGSSRITSTIVALLYGFSAWMTVWIEWNIHGFVYALLPLLLLTIQRKKVLLSISISTLIVFVGHPQMALIALTAAALFALATKRFLWFVKVGVLVGVITAIQWWPMVRYYKEAGRERESAEFSYRETLFEWSQLPRLMAPNIFGNPATENYSGKGNFVETTAYTGIALIIFALYGISKKRAVAFPLTLLGLIVLFAFPNPLSFWIGERHIPVLSTSVASRWLMLFPLAMSMLAASGLDRVLNALKGQTLLQDLTFFGIRRSGKDQIFRKDLILRHWPIVFMAVIFISLWFWSFSASDSNHLVARRNLVIPTTITLATMAAIFFRTGPDFSREKSAGTPEPRSLALRLRGRRPRAEVRVLWGYPIFFLVFSISLAELTLFAHKTMTYTEPRFIYPDVPVLNKLQELTQNGERFGSTEGSAIESNFATWYGLYDVAGYDALYPKRVGELVWAAHRQGDFEWDYPRSTVVSPTVKNNWRDRFWTLAGVKWILHKDDNVQLRKTLYNSSLFEEDRFRLVWTEGKWQIYENLLAFPRAFFISDLSWIGEGPDMIRKIYNDPLPEIVPATITRYESMRVEIAVDAPSDGYLVLTDTYYPGWKVTVDGQRTEIKPAFHAFRGVKMANGLHKVEFVIEPSS